MCDLPFHPVCGVDNHACIFSVLSFVISTTITSADALPDPEQRFLAVLRYYLSGWHIKPKGVKKPCVKYIFPVDS